MLRVLPNNITKRLIIEPQSTTTVHIKLGILNYNHGSKAEE
jgi:hypothetical protein